MKKIPVLLIAFLFFNLINAQVEIKPGLKGGLNIANLTNMDNIGGNSKSITSFHIGGTLSFKFADFYTLQPEILYSKQGSDFSVSGTNNGQFQIELNYLSIPVNNKFYAGDNGLNFQVAPIIDILLSHKNVNDPQAVDIAVAFAIGYDIASGVYVSVAYKQGITDLFGRNVNTGNGYQTTDVGDLILNKVIQLSVGYQFDL
ncbi:outer membrane beta-barrel protein [Algibacter sp. 2305UL17-15]|uniref:outer membrane beta-barrel protein n=1 Tax=Algibacter sp. 2305UL17-15 TaxID=3231268 RepID=UPI0034582AF8